MKLRISVWVLFLVGICHYRAYPQRSYAANTVLSTGNWYKIGVLKEGIYKVDINLLTSLGINISNLSAASIRLYGNGGGMLDESNAGPRPDDLVENPIEVFDGGDGIFNGQDYFLFYAQGPQRWIKDSVNQLFSHRKNLYADTAYYFLTIGGIGKRISALPAETNPTIQVNSYNERYYYENNLVNHLNSGKEWYGEEFNANLGGSLVRNFTVDWPNLSNNSPLTLVTDLAARSIGTASSFSVKLNGQQVQNPLLTATGGNLLDLFATSSRQKSTNATGQGPVNISFTFNPGISGAQGWLNWFELHGRLPLTMGIEGQVFFRDWQSVSTNAIARYTITNNGGLLSVWDISNPLQAAKITVSNGPSQTVFNRESSVLHEFVAFTNAAALFPVAMGKISNQNLHNSQQADMILLTHTSLLAEAQRLAQFHQKREGLKTVTVTVDQVFNEFSSGTPDPAALRDFVKMYFDKAGNNAAVRPKYLLLFGSASYDYRNRIRGNANLVQGYETINSLDPLASYTSDDFFGLLDDGDDINQNNPLATIDIGVGRIPAKDLTEAKTMVDKIEHYYAKESLGAWRNQTVFVADDQDNNLHLNDAETVSDHAAAANSLFNPNKIYLDAYPMESSSGGARYPKVNEAIVSQLFKGALVFNYSGHGSYQRLAEESVLTQVELAKFNNPDKLPLFITASCDFAPHDDPVKSSLGKDLLTANNTGAIALLTTTRLVFAYSNKVINDNYLQIALKPEANGQYLSLGESVRRAKNFTSLNSGDIINNRKFTLLGDPAMRLAFPELRLQLKELNGKPILNTDTLYALRAYTFSGIVTDGAGLPITDYQGSLQTTVYDKAQTSKTLGNAASSLITEFRQLSAVLYQGTASIINGKFQFSFIVPKDINFQSGNGRISMYADNGLQDANGVNTGLYIGQSGNTVLTDNEGPLIRPFLNDEAFKNGGLTHENPVLLVKLFDSSGISTSGNGIGHDITAVMDGQERSLVVLNGFYTADKDSYQSGKVVYQLPTLTEGKHSIRIKAWDVANQSSEVSLDFEVVKQEKLALAKVQNFPNPFQRTTVFAFEHNQPDKELDITINIYQAGGVLVKQLKKLVKKPGTRNIEIIWDGDNQSGAKLPKGIYIYKVMVASGAQKAENTRQLILF
ncbi:MAG: type secretion system sortase PorU [Bacteroidota bacterium]